VQSHSHRRKSELSKSQTGRETVRYLVKCSVDEVSGR
jgi:hypothetical protein